MNAPANITNPLAKLREPFPPHQISKLPKPYKRDSAKGKCSECGGYHGLPAVHLDYVGHAALTDRLLDTDPEWTWEPVADPASHGLPVTPGGMWIKLIVCGVSRYGYGCADGKSGGDAIKETIGDALRNAAMRFGAALDLWHKGDLHLEDETAADGGISEDNSGDGKVSRPDPANSNTGNGKRPPQHSALKTKLRGFVHELHSCGDGDELTAFLGTPDSMKIIEETQEKLPHLWSGLEWPEGVERPEEFVPLAELIAKRERECAEATAAYMGAG